MKMIKAFFRLVRFPNLLIIMATQCLMRYGLLAPLLRHMPGEWNGQPVVVPDLHLALSGFQFMLLVFSTVMLTAAGYVINDYFDTRTDRINRPERMVIDREISRRKALVIHVLLNVLGVSAGVYLSYSIGFPFLAVIFVLIAGLLWFYSTTYKRQFLIGNLLVAFLTALVPFTVTLFEIPLLNKEFSAQMIVYHATWRPLVVWSTGISAFAFLLTLIREIIKDMEDYEGDLSYGRRSIPVVAGLDATRYTVIALIVITAGLIVWVVFGYLRDPLTMIYSGVMLLLPLLWLLWRMLRARSPKEYHRCSLFTKWIMLAGLLYIVLADYLFSTLLA
jgi:4-hydroxybenzoate polyprenyltransferase